MKEKVLKRVNMKELFVSCIVDSCYAATISMKNMNNNLLSSGMILVWRIVVL